MPALPPPSGATRRAALLAAAAAGAGLYAGAQAQAAQATLPVQGRLPTLDGAGTWINTEPITTEALHGKVVLVEFWTYSCINCLNVLPHVRDWHARYRDQGLLVLGVHTPEFAYEKDIGNVKGAVKRLGIEFPVVTDNDFARWRAFGNQYWPAMYFADAQGRIRHHHFGEGEYGQSEGVIRQLLAEANMRAPGG